MPHLPLYKEVKEKIIQALAAEKWAPGAKLPVEKQLARRYGVGIATLRAAVGELEAAGILSRQQGRGTFVSEHTNQSRLYRFFNLVSADGVRRTPSREFVSLRRDGPTPEEVDILRLSRYGKKSDVFRLRITFSLEQQVTGVSDITLPVGLFGRVSRDGVCDGSRPLYALYQSNYNVNVISVGADISADTAPPDVAPLLRVKAGQPALMIRRRAYTYADVPVEYRVSWVNTTGCRFHIDQGSSI